MRRENQRRRWSEEEGEGMTFIPLMMNLNHQSLTVHESDQDPSRDSRSNFFLFLTEEKSKQRL